MRQFQFKDPIDTDRFVDVEVNPVEDHRVDGFYVAYASGGLTDILSEEEACAEQRAWRLAHGRHPMTASPLVFDPPSQRISNHAISTRLAGQALRLSGSHTLAEGCFATAGFLTAMLDPTGGLETPKMLLLSTSHITEETNYLLDAKCQHADTLNVQVPLVFAKGEYGYLLPLIDEPDDRERWAAIPDLAGLRAVAEANGCSWIMLDRDAEVVDGLPSYDW